MNIIWAICVREVKTDVYSGKFFLATFFFLIFMGAFFFYYTDGFIAAQQARLNDGQPLPGLSVLISSVFGVLHFVMILLIPAMTMGSFAEEHQSDTLRALLSAPVPAWKVVAGKYLAVAFSAGIILMASLIFPVYLAAHARVSVGLLISAYLGLFLLTFSQLAFGLWISSLCKSQFSAFMFTVAGLFFLLLANMLAVSVKGFSLTHILVRYSGAAGHFSGFIRGMISVSDVVYFLVFGLFFLFMTTLSYDSYRWR